MVDVAEHGRRPLAPRFNVKRSAVAGFVQ
jgi:hypothetical protein